MPTNRASMAPKPANRTAALQAYIVTNGIVVMPAGAIGELAARFSSFANTVQARMNSAGGTVSALGGTLEAQVDRALSQTLRQPGGTATLAGPSQADSAIASLVGGTAGLQPTMSPYQAALLREARITQADFLGVIDTLQPLSPFTDPGDVSSLQALVRAEVNALLEEFSYTSLLPRQQRVRVLLGGLLGWDYDYYRVSNPFETGAPAGDIQAFARILNLGGPLIPTIQVEDQLASQLVLANDAVLFGTQWFNFWNSALKNTLSNLTVPFSWPIWEPGVNQTQAGQPIPGGLGSLGPALGSAPPGTLIALGPQSPHLPQQASWQIAASQQPSATSFQSYAEKMIQADLLMPVIAQDAGQVQSSLEAIGYTSGEQETTFVEFWSAVDADLLPWSNALQGNANVPTAPTGFWTVLNGSTPSGAASPNPALTPIPVYMTVADIIDWARNLVGPGGSDLLRQAGALGLNLLCDQADELFWLALAMLDPTASAQVQELGDPEVQLQVVSLASDLNLLAKLAY